MMETGTVRPQIGSVHVVICISICSLLHLIDNLLLAAVHLRYLQHAKRHYAGCQQVNYRVTR